MKKKIILFLIPLTLLMITIKTSYSRYVSKTEGSVNTDISGWNIVLNNEDIISNRTEYITITPEMLSSKNVAPGKVAPGSEGYLPISIDISNVDVPFSYLIEEVEEERTISDLKLQDDSIFAKYDTDLWPVQILDNSIYEEIRGKRNFNKVWYEFNFFWDDSDKNEMNDKDDTDAIKKYDNASIKMKIEFKQLDK